MFITDPNRWYYNGEHRGTHTNDINAGDIVIWKRHPYRVEEITPRPHVNWNERYLAAWERSGRPDPEGWFHRPFAMIVTRMTLGLDDDKPKPDHLEAAGSHYWTVIPEHFVVCRLCGELPPCTEVHNERIFARASEQFADAMTILPGFCHHCKEPITRRQGSIRFEGANLIRPDLGENSAIFHARQSGGCSDAAFSYDQRWVAAEPGRAGKLSCPGFGIYHADGSVECSLEQACAGATNVLGEPMRHIKGSTNHYPAYHHRGRGYPGSDCWCTGADAAIAKQTSTVNGDPA